MAAVALMSTASLVGCGDGGAPAGQASVSAVPADLLLATGRLPAGFAPAQLSVSDLVEGNREPIEAAAEADVSPPDCRPTADAELNQEIDAANSAVLAARSSAASLVELVTTAQRDISADIAASTGRCATTTTVIGNGNLRGARIVTRYTELPTPPQARESDRLRQSVLLRSDVTTTLPDGTATTQVGFAGYALLVPDGDTTDSGAAVTVQLTVSGESTAASDPPADARPPMTDAAFGALFDDALSAATR
ncbi:MAG: hypothetical protein SW127_08645 [Actinomycetota bacterium]|nr:hypothetical protein [Actinomycetota bacterium]